MDLFAILLILLLAVMFAAAIVIALQPSDRRRLRGMRGLQVTGVHDTGWFATLLGSHDRSGHHHHHAHLGHHHHGSSGMHHVGGHHFGGHDSGGLTHSGADVGVAHGHH